MTSKTACNFKAGIKTIDDCLPPIKVDVDSSAPSHSELFIKKSEY